ncbi:hypothetical protein [Croceitalea sp. P059]|uniref:hypothetical protein n=1 Tax=Croceitalea sp. P059 TaxID=3075601 RepID=UPI00288746B5|nr:hypothetical protein [Croceitalea sp. P059]MDT0539074.1 hypothetical protein [Croceitalea sp. P059]
MNKTIVTLILAIATMTFCNAQKIEMEKVFGGYKYTQDGNLMTMKGLVKTMESDQQAFDLIKKAQSNNTLASIIGFAGGGLIGWPIGTAIGGGDANWTLAGIGAGLVAIGIPIQSSVNKKTKQAVELYNSSLNSTTFYEFKPEFKVIANGNGIGLAMNF